jgi:hypothetical protein
VSANAFQPREACGHTAPQIVTIGTIYVGGV